MDTNNSNTYNGDDDHDHDNDHDHEHDLPFHFEDEVFTGELGTISDDNEGLLEADDRQAEEIREIFGTAFIQYLQPVEEIVGRILKGDGDAESIEALKGTLDSLKKASLQMGFESVHHLLLKLQRDVETLDPTAGLVDGETREIILEDLLELRDLAEELGGQSETDTRTPQQSIYSALSNRKEFGDLVLRRLSAAGLIMVDQLLEARPDEIAAVSGLGLDMVEKILTALRAPSDRKTSASPVKPKGGPPLTAGKDDSDTSTPPPDFSFDDWDEEDEPQSGIFEMYGAMDAEEDSLEALHDSVLARLTAETEVESRIESLKFEIRAIRERIAAGQEELSTSQERYVKKQQGVKDLAKQVENVTVMLDKVTARRNSIARKCAVAEEHVRQREVILESLVKKRTTLSQQATDLNHSVMQLVERVGRMRRRIATFRQDESNE